MRSPLCRGQPESLAAMQQALNYPYPQIYWVDSGTTSPWAPPGTVLPCPPSVPGRPGQRRPPPPPPPPSPPPPPPSQLLPPLPLPPLKKRRDHNPGRCLLLMFFMILVALVAVGLGMFQLFHLQKELVELREVSCPVVTASPVLGVRQLCEVAGVSLPWSPGTTVLLAKGFLIHYSCPRNGLFQPFCLQTETCRLALVQGRFPIEEPYRARLAAPFFLPGLASQPGEPRPSWLEKERNLGLTEKGICANGQTNLFLEKT